MLVEFGPLVYDIVSLDKTSLKTISDHTVVFLVFFQERERTKNVVSLVTHRVDQRIDLRGN